MFEPVPAGDAFIARSQGYSLRLTADGARFLPRGAADGSAVTLRFAGGAAALRPERTLSTTLNILQGPRAAWRTGVHPFAAVRMAHVYDGVDAVFYGHGERIEYDLVVAPGASVEQVRVRFEGAQRMELDGTDLRVISGRDTMTHHAPLAYQEIAGRRTEVPAHYSLHADDTVGFEVADYDRTAPLVIDPTISYSSYIGATGRDLVRSITTDAAGNAYLAGDTEGGDLPGSAGTTHGQFSDAYVAKLRADGTPEWVTILGGTNQPDAAMAVAAGPTGDVYVTGFSWSADFPVTAGAYRGTTEHTCDAFVARIGSDGGLKYSTMLGAPQPWGVGCGMRAAVVDPQGRAIVAGATASPSFTPTFGDSVGPLAPGLDQPDALVAAVSADGTRLEWSRLFSGSGFDYATAIARDRFGRVYVAGNTTSSDFPVRNPFRASKFEPGDPDGESGYDGFIATIGTDGTVDFSTYLGSAGEDEIAAIAVGQFDRLYVGGSTTSFAGSTTPPAAGTPSRGVLYEVINSGVIGSAAVAATGLSGVTSIGVGPDWGIWATGYSDGAGFQFVAPDDAAPQQAGGGLDIVVAKYDASLQVLQYNYLLGGSGDDRGYAVAVDRLGDIYVGGASTSSNYPVRKAAQAVRRDADATSTDGVMTRLGCAMHVWLPIATQPASGGTGSFDIFSADGCIVEPISDSPWLHVTAIAPGRVSFTTDPNPTASERRGVITVSRKEVAAIAQAAGTVSGTTAHDEIVLNPRDVSAMSGAWQLASDDVHGLILAQPDAGAPKLGTAAASPTNWFSFTFTADAGKPYHLWIHGRAQDDSWQNDSIYAQFSDSLDAAGKPVYRTQGTSAAWVSLEECSGCGEHGWGWQDNAYGTRGDLGPDIYFETSGTHTILLQTREDGFSIGQIVLSAKAFLRSAPGGATDDPTFVTATAAPAPSVNRDEIVLWTGSDAAAINGTWKRIADPTAAGQASVWNADAGAPKLAAPSDVPVNYVDLTFDADAGKPYHLWLRMKADADYWTNDSVWLQFSGALDVNGAALSRIGTPSGTWVSLEECSGCGEQGWGWQDSAYGSPGDLAAPIYFAKSGPQTIRIQVREDGVSVDQIVLSASRYATAAPGAAKNDHTIVPRTR